MLNPYVEWLGLDARIEQPNHFELFGLDLQEDRGEFISTAADRAMAKVRRCRPGEHAKRWAELLDQLEQAKKVLVDSQQRQDYRQHLQARERLSAKGDGSQQDQSAAEKANATKPHTDPGTPGQQAATTAATKTSRQSAKQRPPSTMPPASTMPPSISAAMAPPTGATRSVASNPAANKTTATKSTATKSTATKSTANKSTANKSSSPKATPTPEIPKTESPPPKVPATSEVEQDDQVPVLRKANGTSETPKLDRQQATDVPAEPIAETESVADRSSAVEPDPMAPVAIPTTQVADTIDPMAPVAAANLASSMDRPSTIGADSAVASTGRLSGEDFQADPVSEAPPATPTKVVSDQPVMIAADESRGRSSGAKRLAIAGGLVAMLVVLAVVLVWQLPGILGGDSDSNDTVADASDADSQADSNASSNGNTTTKRAVDDDVSDDGDVSDDDDVSDDGDQTSTTNVSGNGEQSATSDPTDSVADDDNLDDTDITLMTDDVVGDNRRDDMVDDPADDPNSTDNSSDGNSSSNDTSANADVVIDETLTDTSEENSSSDREPEVADVIAFGEGLREVQQMLYERKIDEALERLVEVRESIPHRAQDAALADRLSMVADHVAAFWQAVESGAAMLQGGEELRYSETTIVLVVEVQPDLLIYRFEGTNHRMHPRELPAGLAMLVAEKGLPQSASEARLVKGAFYAIERLNKPSLGDRAIEFWEEAELMGAEVEQLLLYLEDNYSLESSIVEQGPMPSPDAIEAASQAVADQVRESHGTVTSSSGRIRVAEELLAMAPKASEPAERYALFVEAADWAARAGETPIVIAAADSLAAWFVLDDELQIKTDWLVQAGRANGGVDAAKETARTAIEVAETAIDDDRLEIAESLLQTALLASRRSRDRDFQARTLERVTAIREQLED